MPSSNPLLVARTASMRPATAIALVLGITFGLAGRDLRAQADASPTTALTAAATAHPERWPRRHSPVRRSKAVEARIRELLAAMTPEDKVGQIIQADIGSVTPEDIRQYRLGSVLAGGNSDPAGKYNATPAQWLALADAYYRASVDPADGRPAIPLLLGIDAVHGHNNVVGATLFPHNIALGATRDPKLVARIAAATAAEVRATGFDWTFAPTVTVPQDDRWGRTYEGYAEDPALVARYATAMVQGLQGRVGSRAFLDQRHVLASSKHFIGDGGTFEGKDKGDTRVDEATLRNVHGAGHLAALQAGVQTVMASFSSWNGQKMHGNHSLLTDLLKTRLGFDGFVIGDWNGHGEVTGCSNDDCPAALLAGVDMYMAPDSWRGLYANTLAQVRSGQIPMARLDDAVARILRVKLRMGLFTAGAPSARALGGHFDELGSAAHRALARQAVRESLVLLKNNSRLLPLDPHAHVLVAGDGADDIGKQSGGWTLSWQGTGNQAGDFPHAQSIWAGIQAATAAAGGRAELSVTGDYTARPDVAIVVFGESPYAEFLGDVPNLAYQPGTARDLALLRRLHAAGIPVVSVFLSGRPLWVNREINASDAFVAAWWPGSEGGGIADVLFRDARGRVVHDFRGKLPYSWPMTATQGPLNIGQADYHPLFAYGYGLRYRDHVTLAPLAEDSGLRHEDSEPGVYFRRGAVAPGWSFRLADDEGEGVAIDALPSGDRARHVDIAATDHRAQEDARRLRWRGDGPGRIWLHAEAPLDLTRESHAGRLLVAEVRLTAAPAGEVSLGLACGPGCGARLPLGALLRTLTPGQWQRIGVPLACFERAGADLTRVTDLFEWRSAAPLEVAVSDVSLGTEADLPLACPSP